MEENLQNPLYPILSVPLKELPVTETFLLRCKLMGFSNLGEILDADLTEVSALEDYSERWYFELISLLQRNGLIHLISR